MDPKRALSLFLILLALTVGGCTTRSPLSQAVDAEFTLETAIGDADSQRCIQNIRGIFPQLIIKPKEKKLCTRTSSKSH